MAKKYYWLKLPNDFFRDRFVKKLRKLPGGDAYTVIYLKMMLATLATDGWFSYTGIEDKVWAEIALEIDEDEDATAITCQFLQKAGLLVVSEDGKGVVFPKVMELTGSESDSAERVRRFRERKALHCNGEALLCNADVTKSNTEIEKEKERELERDREVERESEREGSNEPSTASRASYQEFIDSWNTLSEFGITPIRAISNKRSDALRARLRQYGNDSFNECVEAIRQSDFLQGRNNRGWTVTFDWLVKPSNYPKVLEGNYSNKGQRVEAAQSGHPDFLTQMANW